MFIQHIQYLEMLLVLLPSVIVFVCLFLWFVMLVTNDSPVVLEWVLHFIAEKMDPRKQGSLMWWLTAGTLGPGCLGGNPDCFNGLCVSLDQFFFFFFTYLCLHFPTY